MGINPFESDFSFADYAADIEQYTPSVDKTSLLASSVQEKVNKLGTVTRDKFYDADTYYVGKQGVRLGEPTGLYPQAPESPHTIEQKYNRLATPEELAQYETSMKVLDNYAAGVVPAPQEVIKDLVENPLSREDQLLYNTYVKETQMQPMEATGIEGHTGYYNRPIAQVQNPVQSDTLQERLIQSGIASELQGAAANSTNKKLDRSIYAGAAPSGNTSVGETAINTLKALPAGVLDAASMIAGSAEALYKGLGGDYLEKDSDFAREYPTYSSAMREIVDVSGRAADYIEHAKTNWLGYDRREQEALVKDIGKAFDEDNYFSGFSAAVMNNPLGAVEAGLSMYAPSKVLTAGGIAAAPGVLGNFSDNLEKAQSIYKKEYGKEAEGEDLAVMIGLSAAGTALDTAGAHVLYAKSGANKVSDAIDSSINALVDKVPSVIATAALGGGAKLAKYMGIEGLEEAATEAAVTAAGVQDIGKLTEEEYLKGIYEAGALGAVAGPGMKAADIGVAAVKEMASPDNRQKMIDTIKARQDKKKAKQADLAVEEEPTTLSAKYGDNEAVAIKEQEHKTAVDKALADGDTNSAIDAIIAYGKDFENDTESLLDAEEFVSRYEAVKAAVDQTKSKIAEGKATSDEVKIFGSSPKAIELAMEDMDVGVAEEFVTNYVKTYGSEAPGIGQMKVQVEVKKTMAEVGKEISDDIKKKAKAVQNAQTERQKEKAIADFDRFWSDRRTKSRELSKWAQELERELEAEAEKSDLSREDFLKQEASKTNSKKGQKNSDTEYTNKDIQTKALVARRSDIAQSILAKDAGKEHDRGIYAIVKDKEKEVKAYDAQGRLLGLIGTSKEELTTENQVDVPDRISETTVEDKDVEKSAIESLVDRYENSSEERKVEIIKKLIKDRPKQTEDIQQVLSNAQDDGILQKVNEILRKEVKPTTSSEETPYADAKEGEAVPLSIEETKPSETDNYVSNEIINNSSLQKFTQDMLIIKQSSSKLSRDPRAGKEVVDKLAKLDTAFSFDNIANIIDEKFGNLIDKGIFTSKTVRAKEVIDKDPAKVLFDKNDKLHPNVVGAIGKSLVEYLLKYGIGVIKEDPKQVAQMLGYGDNPESMPSEAMGIMGGRVFKKNVTNVLGKVIANDLGIKVDQEAVIRINKQIPDLYNPAENLEEKFYADLGQIAAIVGGELGIFSKVDDILPTNQISTSQYAEIAANVRPEDIEVDVNIDLISIGELGKKLITSKDIYTTFNEIMNEYSDGSYLKEVRFEPVPNKKEVVQKVDAQVFNVPQQEKDIINKARKQAWKLDFNAIELFKSMEDVVKEYLEYVKPTEIIDKDGSKKLTIPNLAFVDEQNQLAKNNAIELKLKLLDSLAKRISEQGVDSDLFFEYFYGANGRNYLDTNEMNPQNDKFNRFIAGLSSNKVTVDLEKNGDTFYIALAQSFGEDIDKMSTESAIQSGKDWLTKGSNTIIEELKAKKFKPEAVGHALQGILAVKAYEDSSGKPFETNLVIETDAVTSGIILKLMQLPVIGVNKTKELLKKGGIVFEGDNAYATFEGTNKLIADGQLDLYRTIAQSYSGKIQSFLDGDGWEVSIRDGEKLTKNQEFVNQRRKSIIEHLSKDTGVLPKFTTEESKITGKLRSVFKPVVMVFGYGGGIESIKHKFISEIIEELPTKLLEERKLVEAALKNKKQKPDTPIRDLFRIVAPNIQFTVKNIRESDILDIKVSKRTIRDILTSDMVALYGTTLETALSDVFGEELVNANKDLNNAFRMMFRVFDYKYQKKIKTFEDENNRRPSIDEKAEIILDMKEEFPAVAPPFAKDDEKGIIIDTKTSSDIQIKAQTFGNFERNNGQKSITVQAVVKEFEEAISAGNVVPIHYIDGTIMGKTFLNVDGITQVFDAIVANMGNAKNANSEYNKQVIEISKEYSLTKKVLESLQQSKSTLSKEELDEFLNEDNEENNKFTIEETTPLGVVYNTIDEVIRRMEALNDNADKVRDELFSSNIKSDHMTGLGAVVEIKYDRNTKVVDQQEAADWDTKQYADTSKPAVSKKESGIIPGNKFTNKVREKALKKDCEK